jgi:diguanylate cyclase (GGDEF)-like protein
MERKEFKILIVDDSALNIESLKRILVTDGGATQTTYAVITASSGREALDKAATERPDLILLDIVMPGIDGFEVLKRLKDNDLTRHMPVIIISGLYSEENEEKGFFYGAVDYIRKPFNKSIAQARIKTHLRIIDQMRIIERLSLVDPLTGIPNRRSFDNRMVMEFRRAFRDKTTLSLLMIDADRFKVFNDMYGHLQGDVALKSIALTINSAIRRPGDFLARWGGEEFVVLLPNTPFQGAFRVAEQIRESIEKAEVPGIGDYPPLKITVSIGVATATPSSDNVSIEDLIGQADKALYTAKATGRNRVCP